MVDPDSSVPIEPVPGQGFPLLEGYPSATSTHQTPSSPGVVISHPLRCPVSPQNPRRASTLGSNRQTISNIRHPTWGVSRTEGARSSVTRAQTATRSCTALAPELVFAVRTHPNRVRSTDLDPPTPKPHTGWTTKRVPLRLAHTHATNSDRACGLGFGTANTLDQKMTTKSMRSSTVLGRRDVHLRPSLDFARDQQMEVTFV